MRFFVTALFALPLLIGANPELLKVKSVYFLPMSNGLDQYLANHLLKNGTYVVVTDPANADAVFTDSLGPALERKLAELYPSEEEEEEQKAESPGGNFRRGRGMVFLVERKSRQVVWSAYQLPRDTRPQSLDRSARKIAEDLKKHLTAKVTVQ